ncbi:MAG: PSD1 and planctomycete cytochrome C domain-containing protein [Bacteroidota bacterium]
MKTKLPIKTSLSISFFLLLFVLVLSNQACHLDEKANQLSASVSVKNSIPAQVDFIFHVKPILSDKCFKCHGPDEQKIEGDLQLHTQEKAFAALGKNKDRHAIIPRDAEHSTLIQRIFTEDPNDLMPPPEANLALNNREKAILKRWIEQGAEWKTHWAFVPPSSPPLPEVKDKAWITNAIDHFILKKLEDRGLDPSPSIRKAKLSRRLSFDRRGLPPSIEEINSFLADDSPEHYAQLVDQFMDSDAFAERMANEWLDLARYADTHGYQDDLERIMWPWRDWVIHAFKKNMPYDQFVLWQLAGDLLPNASKEQIIATAFNRNHKITQEGGVISEEYRAEYVTDRTNTFGTAFLGLTFECAKCHDHKYDPISQEEYFQLYGFFNNVKEKGLIEVYGQVPEPYIELTKAEIKETLDFIKNLDTLEVIPLMVMEELDTARTTHVLNRGLYDQPAQEVKVNVPHFGQKPKSSEPKFKNRLDLSQWLFEEENPLFARVIVNRLWQQIFGKGIVKTANDFGNQGALPTHPHLLDHLAVEFRTNGWDIRQLLKHIVTSSTYRQDYGMSPQMLEIDPANDLLARTNRSRLSAEMIRDHALCISGLLVEQVGGPSVKPYQPGGLWLEVAGGGMGSNTVYVQDEGEKSYRRSMYTFWKRTVPPPNMMLFDTPTRDVCAVQREQTSTPLQALVLLNDPQFLEAAQALALRALKEKGQQTAAVIQYMFQLATSRMPSQEEMEVLKGLYESELQNYQQQPNAAKALLKYGKPDEPSWKDELVLAAHSYIASTIFNLDETVRK